MKTLKRTVSLLLAVLLVMALESVAFAANPGTIIIENAAKGKVYNLYKIFDAYVDPANPSAVVYTTRQYPTGMPGVNPFTGNEYFTVDANGYVTATPAAKNGTQLTAAAVNSLRALATNANKVASKTGDGNSIEFDNLDYGYYFVDSEVGSAVMIDTNNRTIIMNDKNTPDPGWHPEPEPDPDPDPDHPEIPVKGKSVLVNGVNKEIVDANIGDVITFQIKIDTTNYGKNASGDSKKIVSYLIGDTFPAGLALQSIESVTVDGSSVPYAAASGKFPIKVKWAEANTDGTFTSLYNHGAVLCVTYKAKLTANAVIDGAGNINTVSFNYKLADRSNPDNPNVPEPPTDGEGTTKTDSATVFTYAIALLKVNAKGTYLANATFELPFHVTAAGNGVYTVCEGTAGTNTVTTDASGKIVIKGMKAGSYSIKETAAPAGYNLPTDPFTVTAVKTGATTTTFTTYLDADGNVVSTSGPQTSTVTYNDSTLSAHPEVIVNRSGAILPSTGGIGTTVFYVLGSILVVGAALIIVTRKRMSAEA